MITTPAQRDLASLQHTLATTGDDARTQRLTRLESVWKGLRYELESRPSFWDNTVPLAERAPCVVYPILRSAGLRVVSLVFGEGRFPRIAPHSKDEAQGNALAAIVTAAQLRQRMRELMEQGLACGSACALCAVRDGRLCVEIIPAKWATPELDVHQRVTALDVRFKYQREGRWYWYRRTLTAEADTVYEPLPVDTREPVWVPATQVPQHGFVPVVWIRNDPDPTDPSFDGCAFGEGLEDELEALDFALSMRHRTARYNGDPITVRILGEHDADDPDGGLRAERGRDADPRAGTYSGWAGRIATAISGALKPVIKKAPGNIVSLSSGGDMKLVESTGAGANMLSADADDLRRKILETLGVVVADPETISANASAALQKQLYAPMLARCDGYRVLYGDALCEVVRMFVRLLRSPAVRGTPVRIEGWASVASALDALGDDPPIDIAWGEYFDPTPADVQAAVAAAQAAVGGRPVVSHRTAVRYVASLLGVEDVDAEVAAIEAEEAGGADVATKMLGAIGGRAIP